MSLNKLLSSNQWRIITDKILVRNVCKIAVAVHPELSDKLEKNELKHRHHPGIVKTGQLAVPKRIEEAILKTTGDYPIKTLQNDGKTLCQYISSRHPPPEIKDIQKKIKDISEELDKTSPLPNGKELSEKNAERMKQSRQHKIQKILKERTFAWKPITYGTYEAMVYAVSRSAQEYSVLMSILKEIESRQPDFKPRSFFDFGSGVGTAMWAASNLWKETIFEYVNVDSSREMNDLSDLILRDGNENQQSTLRNVFYRQFLPSIDNKYNLVVSAYTLFELPSAADRKELVLNLWRKCDGYLVIAEEGTRKASELVNEARDYVLALNDGHVFAPCPHDFRCPRLALKDDKTPCNFQISYDPLSFGKKSSGTQSARYSYVVLKKGQRADARDSWPRLIRPTLVRSKHTVCRMCTSKGSLQEIIFTQSKHGKDAYRCARASEWGDRLPIEIGEEWSNTDSEDKDEK